MGMGRFTGTGMVRGTGTLIWSVPGAVGRVPRAGKFTSTDRERLRAREGARATAIYGPKIA